MQSRSSRREFLVSAAAAGATTSFAAEPGPILAYAGTYSAPVGAEGAPGRGKGIYLFEMNPATGALVEREEDVFVEALLALSLPKIRSVRIDDVILRGAEAR